MGGKSHPLPCRISGAGPADDSSRKSFKTSEWPDCIPKDERGDLPSPTSTGSKDGRIPQPLDIARSA